MVKSHQYGRKFCYNVFIKFKRAKNNKKAKGLEDSL